jgi:hypothetical protein
MQVVDVARVHHGQARLWSYRDVVLRVKQVSTLKIVVVVEQRVEVIINKCVGSAVV